MGLEVLEEREEARLRLVGAPRDIEAELAQAREEGFAQGSRAAAADVGKAYEHQLAQLRAQLSQKAPRAPLAMEAVPMLEAIAALVGVRVMLAISVVMTFALALQAMEAPTIAQIVVLVVFGIATVGPLSWLATRRSG